MVYKGVHSRQKFIRSLISTMLDHVSSFIYQSIIFTYIYFLREYSDFIFFKMFKNLSLEEMYRTNDISLRKQCMADLEDKKKNTRHLINYYIIKLILVILILHHNAYPLERVK